MLGGPNDSFVSWMQAYEICGTYGGALASLEHMQEIMAASIQTPALCTDGALGSWVQHTGFFQGYKGYINFDDYNQWEACIICITCYICCGALNEILFSSLLMFSFSPHFLLIFSSFSPHFLLIFSSFSPHFLLIFSSFSPHFLLIFSSFSPHFLLIFSLFSPHFLVLLYFIIITLLF
jgi:hypothetical protein